MHPNLKFGHTWGGIQKTICKQNYISMKGGLKLSNLSFILSFPFLDGLHCYYIYLHYSLSVWTLYIKCTTFFNDCALYTIPWKPNLANGFYLTWLSILNIFLEFGSHSSRSHITKNWVRILIKIIWNFQIGIIRWYPTLLEGNFDTRITIKNILA
jgi:hypothetical protein